MTHVSTPAVHYWYWQLIVAMAMNGLVVCIQIGAYAARLAGAQSGRVATALSLFNLFFTVGRTASLIYTPLLGSLADRAAAFSVTQEALRTAALANYEWQLRGIVFAGTIGAVVGTALLPTYVTLLVRGIGAFERTRSLPKALLRLFIPRTAAGVLGSIRRPQMGSVWSLSMRQLPKEVLLFNVGITALYAIGIVSAAFASVLTPGAARTAILTSGLINGVAAVASMLVVDPISAIIVDETARGERPITEVKSLVVALALTMILGTLLSQFLLGPAAAIISEAAHLITGH